MNLIYNKVKKEMIVLAAVALLVSCGGKETAGTAPADNGAAEAAAATAIEADSTLADDGVADEVHSLGGVVTVAPDRMGTVTVLMGGTVGSIAVKPGQYVGKGAVIATIDNPEFVELQRSYTEAVAQTEYLEAEYQRQQSLQAESAASRKTLEQSKAEYLSMKSRKDASATLLRQLGVSPEEILSKGIIPTLAVRSPISGYVGEMSVNIGKYLQAGDPICTVFDQDAAILRLTAFSKDVDNIAVGTRLKFSVKVMPGEDFDAVVTHIDPIMDETSHSMRVYAGIVDKSRKFRVGMYVRARLMK